MENGLTCCGECCYRSSVEAILEGQYFRSFIAVFIGAVFSCGFYCTLVGFCARVREEHFFKPRSRTKQFGELYARLGIIEV